jgi:hypothetical protein
MGKSRYNRPPGSNLFKSGAFSNEHILFTFTQQTYLNEEVNRSELSLSVKVPWINVVTQLFDLNVNIT